ncbi:MAG TPA: bifunctional methylenetetrahydrofolate dehydrogenase/methenyltetrahydrofolate cyclohydrolase, partial [Gammaproteobacteria bacterium]|nr:bifunctional methylenetetrahydrofolate dehydrogenase/methenyltetrahydrofolate cyclohydrolase [Gammaproteobacteria bacterium]
MAKAAIIDGKQFATRLRTAIAAQVVQLKAEHGLTPGLAVVLVGEDPASQIYVRNKGLQVREAGMNSFEQRLPVTTTQAELLACIANLNQDSAVNGILVQLPLPKQIDPEAVIAAIAVSKDVDGFHPLNAGLLAVGAAAMVPCTPLGCLMMLKAFAGSLAGQRAVVLGRSNIVGKPM